MTKKQRIQRKLHLLPWISFSGSLLSLTLLSCSSSSPKPIPQVQEERHASPSPPSPSSIAGAAMQAVDDYYRTPQDTSLHIVAAQGLFQNDTIPPSMAAKIHHYDAQSMGGGQVKVREDGSFDYTPSPGYFNLDTFSYALKSSDGSISTAVARIAVQPRFIDLHAVERGIGGFVIRGEGILDEDSTLEAGDFNGDGLADLLIAGRTEVIDIPTGREEECRAFEELCKKHCPPKDPDDPGDKFYDHLTCFSDCMSNQEGSEEACATSSRSFHSSYLLLGEPYGRHVDLAKLEKETPIQVFRQIPDVTSLQSSISSLSDFNQDGYGDLLIYNPFKEPLRPEKIQYFIFGGPQRKDFNLASISPQQADFFIDDVPEGFRSAIYREDFGDWNGDGLPDIFWITPEKGLYIFLGRQHAARIQSNEFYSKQVPYVYIQLEENARQHDDDVYFGVVGDINGDGYDDVAISLKPDEELLKVGGDIILGGPLVGRTTIQALRSKHRVIRAQRSVDPFFGNYNLLDSDYDALGDVNGDGIDDFSISMSLIRYPPNFDAETWAYDNVDFDADTEVEGATIIEDPIERPMYMIFGQRNWGKTLNLDLIDAGNLNSIGIRSRCDERGFLNLIASPHDIDGDGLSDMIVDPKVFEDVESVQILFGNSEPSYSCLEINYIAKFPPFLNIRYAKSIGDVNGDGLGDLVIRFQDHPPFYVVYGGDFQGKRSSSIGTAGHDTLLVRDVVYGGAGNDTMVLTSSEFTKIDGGPGQDQLLVQGSDLKLSLHGETSMKIHHVEKIDLSGHGRNELILDFQGLRKLVPHSRALEILGDGDDHVMLDLASHGFTQSNVDPQWIHFKNGIFTIRISSAIKVQANL